MASRSALMVVVGVLLLLGGCGLPSKTEPKYAGAAQSAAPPPSVSSPDGPDVATTASAAVTNFLQTSVGANLSNTDNRDAPNPEILERMRKFMTEPMARRWQPAGGLTVIRKAEVKQDPEVAPNGKVKVSVLIDPIGTLGRYGTFAPLVDPDKYTAEFTVAYVGGVFRIENMDSATQSLLLLSEAGFKEWYDWNPIYFWESGSGGKLVPDMRYMPRTLPDVKRVGAVLDSLKSGPSPLLAGVTAVPADYEFKDSSVVKSGTVQINLSGKVAGQTDLSPLARQIRWSLVGHPLVTLTVENEPNEANSENGFNADNVTSLQYGDSSTKQPDKFFVAGGTVRAQFPGTPAGDTPLFAPGGVNNQVVSAAIDRQLSRAALVRPSPPGQGKQTLYVNSPEMPPAKPPTYVPTNVHGTKLSRPAWMTYPIHRVLVIADNALWVGTDDKSTNLQKVSLGGPAAGADLTAFAVAPDGHRIALISGGQVMVASLQVKDEDHALIVGPPQPIDTLLGSNEGVDWLTETVLVVGGKVNPEPPYGERPYSVVAITLDGADSNPLPTGNRDLTQPNVTIVVAQCGDPLESATLSWDNMPINVMVEVNGRVNDVFRNEIRLLQVPEPSPSAEPINPTAPFYPD